VKRFGFPLERVRQWREKQAAIEEAALEKLFAKRRLLEQSREVLEAEAAESARAVALAPSVSAMELQSVDAFRRYVSSQRILIARRIAVCGVEIAAQQEKVREARRRFELLDKLRERKLSAWTAALNQEVEMEAGEAFLAKWGRGSGPKAKRAPRTLLT
jgi:hypothetical protein